MSLLDYAGYAYPVEGLGPGRRIILWVRGCARRCPGCLTPELWAAGTPLPLAHVVADLLPLLAEADGLTISGGEPFDQPEALAALIALLRTSRPDLEVLVYTGYTLEELHDSPLLSAIDLLIDGPFQKDTPNTLQWRGSDNQCVHLLTPRAQRWAPEQDAPMPVVRPLQVQMLDATHFRIIGLPRRGDMDAYRQALTARGLGVE